MSVTALHTSAHIGFGNRSFSVKLHLVFMFAGT